MHLYEVAGVEADQPAYVMAGTGRVVTYGELDAESNRLAQLFFDAGLRPGDAIAFVLENHERYFHITWAAQRSGLQYTAISSRLGADEISYIVNDCGARILIGSSYLREALVETVATTPEVELRLMMDGIAEGFESYEDTVARYPTEPIAEQLEGGDMLYSSGTTGRPKGVKVPLTLEPFGTPPALLGVGQLLFGFQPGIRYLSPAPLYHAAPLRFCMNVIRIGGTVIVMERFDPEDALRLIEEQRATHSQWVPTMFIRMLKLPAEVRERYDVSSMEVAVHAAAPIPVDVKRQMIDWWGPVLHEYYAGTEGNGFVYCNSEQWLANPGTVGQALASEIHICDEEGNELPAGESGTIYFGGGGTFEYHNDDEKTRGSRHPDEEGWSTLGDIGYVNEDGFLFLTDRKAFMIISGGVNIYPQEVENLLVVHPDVIDVAVFGVPNDDFGEEVKAVVQPADTSILGDAEAEGRLARTLIEHCKVHLSSVKCPRTVDFREELPRHPTGKLYKRLLKDEYWAAAGRSI
ncbi:MAG: acyl-CoA synthetase [Actinomycetota bacterium]